MREPLKLSLVQAPAVLPLSLDEAKQHLRLDDAATADDAVVVELTRAATVAAEAFTGRALITQTWDLFLDRWPNGQAAEEVLWEGVRIGADQPSRIKAIALPRPPLQAVVHVKTYDDGDVETLWTAGNYFVDAASTPGRLVARSGREFPLPGRVANGVEIRFSAGYGDAGGDVPEALRQGLLRLVAHLYENRGDSAEVAMAASGAERLWRPYRTVKF